MQRPKESPQVRQVLLLPHFVLLRRAYWVHQGQQSYPEQMAKIIFRGGLSPLLSDGAFFDLYPRSSLAVPNADNAGTKLEHSVKKVQAVFCEIGLIHRNSSSEAAKRFRNLK